jgi:hypothetical protein
MTTTIQTEEPILKSDELGRIRTPVTRRQSLIQEFERSGLSGAKFAALSGIKYSTFASWLQKHRRQAGVAAAVKPADSMRWLEAVVEQAQRPGTQDLTGLVLELPGGVRMQISATSQVVLAAALVRALEKAC